MAAVRIVEVGPRDGLQNIKTTVPTSVKVELIQRLSRTGLPVIEATSFVSPKWIPQLGDAKQVMQAIRPLLRDGSTAYPVLVPNIKGLDAAIGAGVHEVGVFISATEGFSRKNINCSIAESLERVRLVTAKALPLGIRVRAYVSCIFACPYDGPTDPSQVLSVAQKLLDLGCFEVSLGDTLGVGSPGQVRRLLGLLLQHIPAARLAGHFHDTYGQAVANAVAAYDMGLRTFDSSVSGLGGCPYSPGAKGNLATEDIIYTFHQMGIATGVDLDEVVRTGEWIAGKIGIPNGSRAGVAIHTKLSPRNPRPAETHDAGDEAQEYQIVRGNSTVKITLNRPRNGNALTAKMVSSLTEVFQTLSTDSSVFRIIITARGKFFCTGMDLSANGASAATNDSNFHGLRNLFSAIENAPQTTVALVNGPAFGGGVGLAFACDIRLASIKSSFTLTEVKLGICPAVISKYVFREWGIGFAREAMLTARRVGAKELYERTGAIHAIADEETELDTLLARQLDLLKFCAPGASTKVKDLARAAWQSPGSETQDAVIKTAFDTMMRSEEARIGIHNFRSGKRETDWEKALALGKPKL